MSEGGRKLEGVNFLTLYSIGLPFTAADMLKMKRVTSLRGLSAHAKGLEGALIYLKLPIINTCSKKGSEFVINLATLVTLYF